MDNSKLIQRIELEPIREWLAEQPESAYKISDPDIDPEADDSEWLIELPKSGQEHYEIQRSSLEHYIRFRVPRGHELESFGFGDYSDVFSIYESWMYIDPRTVERGENSLSFEAGAGADFRFTFEIVDGIVNLGVEQTRAAPTHG